MNPVYNKKANFDYEILEAYEAGLLLTGPEVKSAKRGSLDLGGSYIAIDKTLTPWLINANISAYAPAKQVQQNYDPTRSRKLLLKKHELIKLSTKAKTQGLTIIPIKVYTKGGLVKIEIGLAKGKKKHDKREDLKKRDTDRKIQQALKNY
ncbi:MAG: SsrA-binding protein SmpB [Patescibacteria group bacterium]|nr:SsrA-binding protein SmpB [Patescibacteria group bacterium]MDD5121701.1 SsrA-binding protein SmpB [Patescibacteria group bacterium]MDD5221696.1 SsrA-binding protein SmpB [Patescibacteria group bacterium]MDD5396135.1 SsrA-binding protein SmpB [Patescibacteria group bacterium]